MSGADMQPSLGTAARPLAGQQKLQPMDYDIGSSSPTINYTMTPNRFMLEIPAAALASLTPDSHTRMLAMLNEWINRHKPVVVKEVEK